MIGTGGGGGSDRNLVQGNFIGTDVTGKSGLANRGGIRILVGAVNNTIGGTQTGAGNTIAFNGFDGVEVTTDTGNAILRNSIFANDFLGIDVGPNGVTLNDPGDGDTGGNNLQNFPVLTSAASDSGSTTIGGTLNSTPSSTFTIELFSNTAADASGFGEGETFLGATTVTTDAGGKQLERNVRNRGPRGPIHHRHGD